MPDFNKRFRRATPDRILTFVNRSETEKPLLQFITEEISSASRNTLKSWLRHGNIKVDGQITSQFDFPVGIDSIVEINTKHPFAVLRHPRLKIIYEDDDIIVVNKGYGLLSVGTDSPKKEETAYGILKQYVKEQNPGNKLFIIHRLDRGTSGLMMFAKNFESKDGMQHNWNNMVLERKYIAVLEGSLEQEEGVVKSFLNETSQYEVYSTAEALEGGRPAVTRYKVVRRGHGYTLAEFQLETGRKNQIRIHCKDLGHPIAGDRKYGARTSPINRLALHAMTLKFVHPRTRKLMDFELPCPTKFLSVTNS